MMNTYTLKVYPEGEGRDIYRTIKICGKDTLDDLCDAILRAFEFDHDHLYEFCMDNRMYGSICSYQRFPEGGEPLTEISLDELGLSEKQKFSLHYDFGDDWMFTIRVNKISEEEVYEAPAVINSKGILEQYPDEDDWDDDDFDDFDEEETDEERAAREKAEQEELENALKNDYAYYFYLLTEDLAFEEDGEAKLAALYDEHWEKVKEAIRKDYFSETADGILAKPSPDFMMSLQEGKEMFYDNLLYDLDEALQNQGQYEKRAALAKDVLELFDLRNGDGSIGIDFMNFSTAIGEALSDAGKIEESEAYFEKLFSEYPDNAYMLAQYILVLKMRGEKKKARQLLEQHINLNTEVTEDNELLFERAVELYEEEGNKKLAQKYIDKLEGSEAGRQRKKYMQEDALIEQLFQGRMFEGNSEPFQMPVRREEKKIYPNDPCPCGSGKKYKKCCGKS